MSYYYPLSIPINSLTHKALGDLAKIIQSKSLQQYSNHEKRYGKEELYRQWLKNTISDASSKIESFIKLFKQILLIGGFQKGILNEASLQGLNLYIKMFIETCINSFKMENEYLAFTKILDNLRQTEQFAWKQYQYASKDQFRKIKQDNLLLIKYFSSLKFNQAPSIKNGELDEKGSIKNILDFLLKLQANGYSSVLLKQISKIKDQNVKQSLQDFAKYYESYCINILKKDTTFFYFLQQLQKDQRNPQDIERIFKRLDKKVQSTFIKLKEGFIKLLSKDRIPQRDNYERVKQLQELVKRKDEQLNKLRNKPYQGNKVMSKDKIFNTPLSSPSKKDLSDIEVLLEQKRTLEAQLSFMKQENEDLRRLKRELEEFKNRQIKNNPQNVIKANYQTPGRNQKMEQRVIRVNNPANQKKQQRHSEELKNNLHKLSQYENSMKKMQVQINRLNTINEDKLKQINYLNSQLATHQNNIQKYKREKEELKQSLEKLSVKQKIPQTRNRQFDQLLQKLNASERKNNQYRDQITTLEQKLKRQQQNSSQQIDRINNEWKKKVSFQQQLQNGANKRGVLISQKSRLIQKMSIQLNQLSQLLAAASQTEGRLREQIRYYTQQLQIHQKRIQSISNQVNTSPRIQGRHRQQSNKQWQNIYQQKLNKLIQLNKKSLFQKQEKIIMLHSRINQLEAYNDQLKGNRFRDYNNSPRK